MEENVLISFKYDALKQSCVVCCQANLAKNLLVRKSCVKLIAVNKQTHKKDTHIDRHSVQLNHQFLLEIQCPLI